ncbi:hypothetical protein NM897_09245 [Planococcus maritimus]|uniref:hypothetical protein n=1 Tax=Planococcus maritimus TaxID=192421 RepID=UPI00313899B3
MAIVQEAFNLPDEIYKKILTGDYIRDGGIVRHNKGSQKGQFYMFLETVDLNKEKTGGRGVQALKFAFENRALIKGGLDIAKVIVAEIYKKSKINEEPDIVVNLNVALNVYFNAVSEGALTMEIIKDLSACLEELKVHSEVEEISITFTLGEFEALLQGVFEYTKKLAAGNSITLTGIDKEVPSHSENPINVLQRNLEVQKRIFELAS